MASPFSWPVLLPYALRAPAPVNLGVRPMQRQTASPTQLRSFAIGIGALAVMPLLEAWAVFSSGTMVGVHCNGMFSQALCTFGTRLGTLVAGTDSAHIGYGVLMGALGTILLYVAWRLRAQAKVTL